MALHGHSAPVTCLASCGMEATDRELVLSGAADGTAMLWSLRRLTESYLAATARRPVARRCPALVIRGHRGPVTACAISDGLGLALTCSDGRALLTAIEGNVLLRVLQSNSGSTGSQSGGVTPNRALATTAVTYSACTLAAGGYAIVAGSRQSEAITSNGLSSPTISHELVVHTVNGRCTARIDGMTHAVRCLSTVGRGELVVVGGEALMLEVRMAADLTPVWSLDPTSWARIESFSGGVLGGNSGASGGVDMAQEALPAVEVVEFGPNPNAPIVLCVGTEDGSLLVQVRYNEYMHASCMLTTVAPY